MSLWTLRVRVLGHFYAFKDAASELAKQIYEETKNVWSFDHGPDCSKKSEQLSNGELRKTKGQLIRLSGTVCGIEFCYAAETAFVSPILLNIGVPVYLMTLVWCLSPILGFFLGPLLGSLSDNCRLRFGRRRPFILLYSLGILAGLILVPRGSGLGVALGDVESSSILRRPSSKAEILHASVSKAHLRWNDTFVDETFDGNASSATLKEAPPLSSRPWGTALTILGVMLLDFCCDCCQSPSRTYLLDMTAPEEHQEGLSTFTIMAGVGGAIGYVMGGVDWEAAGVFSRGVAADEAIGGHVFGLVLFAYLVCLTVTVTAFEEVPLEDVVVFEEHIELKEEMKQTRLLKDILEEESSCSSPSETTPEDEGAKAQEFGVFGERNAGAVSVDVFQGEIRRPSTIVIDPGQTSGLSLDRQTRASESLNPKYDSTSAFNDENRDGAETNHESTPQTKNVTHAGVTRRPSLASSLSAPIQDITLKTYLLSIFHLPTSLRVLCLTNLLSWMSLVSFSLYFTDFVGQSVFGGDPSAPRHSPARDAYESGVRTGSLAMALYSISCSIFSSRLEGLIERFGARRLYVRGQLIYAAGALLMALFPYRASVFLLSPTAGVMYGTLFTIPYILLANYHSRGVFEVKKGAGPAPKRGLGTDVALVSSMVFVAQFLLSAFMGVAVHVTGSTRTVMGMASICAAAGSFAATKVLYLDL